MGFLGFAPIYLNGLLAIFFVFVFPGLAFVRFLDIRNFPQRWFVVILSSLTANHLLVTLIAAFHLNPLQTYRAVAAALAATLIFTVVHPTIAPARQAYRTRSTMLLSDAGWLLAALAILALAYFNIWKHGVPNIFVGSDVSVSWNAWSLTWSEGEFSIHSKGYPQFVPTIWAVTYIFTGSTEQYFAYYIYIILIIAPLALNAMLLGRLSWWQPLVTGLMFVWFIAEIQEPWLRGTLQEGWPDWVAAVFGFSGIVLFVAHAHREEFDTERTVSALLSMWLVTIAAAIKPLYGLFVLAILIGLCTDAAKHLGRERRNRLVISVAGVVLVFVVAYVMNYFHLVARSMPNYPLSAMSERFAHAWQLLNSNFSAPFRFLIVAGVVLSPFVRRVRWLSLPLLIGLAIWANTASYDLRNVLGLLLFSAFIPVYALVRASAVSPVVSSPRSWRVPDTAVALGLTILCVALTLNLAQDDRGLRQRFATEQLRHGLGLALNQHLDRLLRHGCTVLSFDGYIATISALRPFRDQMKFVPVGDPLNDIMVDQFNTPAPCVGIVYPPSRTHPSVLKFLDSYLQARAFTRVTEDRGNELLVSGSPNAGVP